MRITNTMLTAQVNFNNQRSLSRFVELQGVMSSGRRINRASDDPLGTQRDLGYRRELSGNAQFVENINRGLNWMSTYDSTFADLKDLLTTAKELAVGMSDSSFDENARNAAADEVESIFNQFIQLSSTQLEGRYVFSGTRTDTQSLNAYARGVAYQGNEGSFVVPIETSSRIQINYTGSEVFLEQLTPLGAAADLESGIIGTSLLADFNAGQGIDQAVGTFTISDNNLGITSTVDVTGATTMQDVIDAVNAQLAADGITNLTARIGDANNNLMLDYDETAPQLISVNTELNSLNNGFGIDKTEDRFTIRHGGSDYYVDIGSAITVGDVIASFNAAAPPGVSLQIDASGEALEIVNTASGNTVEIREFVDGVSVARDLGIRISVPDNTTGTGSALAPRPSFSVDETTGTTAADLGIRADFSGDLAGQDVAIRLTGDTTLAQLNSGLGLWSGALIFSQGEHSRMLDLNSGMVTVQDLIDSINALGLDITASINPDENGIQVINNDPNRSFTIVNDGGGNAAREMGLFGSSDIMGSLMVLQESLETNDEEGIRALLDQLDEGIQHLLNVRSSAGAKTIRLETTRDRLGDLEYSFTQLLSEVEDADMAEVVTRLATYETNYQASLMASAKLIQPSLMNFLR